MTLTKNWFHIIVFFFQTLTATLIIVTLPIVRVVAVSNAKMVTICQVHIVTTVPRSVWHVWDQLLVQNVFVEDTALNAIIPVVLFVQIV